MMMLTMNNLQEVLEMIANSEQAQRERFNNVLMNNNAMDRYEARTIRNALRDIYNVETYDALIICWQWAHFVAATK